MKKSIFVHIQNFMSNNPENHFKDELNLLIEKSQKETITGETLLTVLSGRGYAFLLIILSLPFCQPIQIPGFSTPFGLILAFIGLRIAFGHHVWIPDTLLKRQISPDTLKKVSSFAIKITDKLRFFIRTRLTWLVTSPILHIIHGLTIFGLALVLALPLPIPLTNLLAAYPILFFGLGMLEDDGLMILIAYALSWLCFFALLVIIWIGHGLLSIL